MDKHKFSNKGATLRLDPAFKASLVHICVLLLLLRHTFPLFGWCLITRLHIHSPSPKQAHLLVRLNTNTRRIYCKRARKRRASEFIILCLMRRHRR